MSGASPVPFSVLSVTARHLNLSMGIIMKRRGDRQTDGQLEAGNGKPTLSFLFASRGLTTRNTSAFARYIEVT